jgi:hypothetical protein
MTDDDFEELLRMTSKNTNEVSKARPKTAENNK